MGTILDLIGSSIIAGLLLVTALSMNASVMKSTAFQAQRLQIQEESSSVTQILDHDMNLIGFRDTSKSRIKLATPHSLVFRTDIDNNGMTDTVAYYFARRSDIPTILGTWGFAGVTVPGDQSDSVLFRFSSCGDPPPGPGRGVPAIVSPSVHKFSFTYLDRHHISLGSTPALKDSIRLFSVEFELNGNPTGKDSLEALVRWQKTYRPKNLDL